MKKILGIIPARYASTRFPGKPLADICGRPMIQHVYERASQAKNLSGVLIATDDEKIFNAAKNFGGQVVMTGSNLPNGTSRCEEAAKIFGGDFDAVINIQGDEPLLDPLMIDEVAELLNENYCATLCRPLEVLNNSPSTTSWFPSPCTGAAENPNIVKVVMSQENYALYFSRSVIPFKRNESSLPFYQHIGIYGYSLEFLKKYVALPPTPLSEAESLEQLKILEHGYKIKIKVTACKNPSIGVDTPEDLERVREIILNAPI